MDSSVHIVSLPYCEKLRVFVAVLSSGGLLCYTREAGIHIPDLDAVSVAVCEPFLCIAVGCARYVMMRMHCAAGFCDSSFGPLSYFWNTCTLPALQYSGDVLIYTLPREGVDLVLSHTCVLRQHQLPSMW